MSQRTVRVNELIKREISGLLHTRYQAEAVYITISEVDVAPDLRQARVFYSVLGDAVRQVEAAEFFQRYGRDIRQRVGKMVVLKYLPALHFIHDPSLERGSQINAILDSLETDDPGDPSAPERPDEN